MVMRPKTEAEEGETVALLAEQMEFVRRGMQSIARSEAAGDWIPAGAVLAKLDAKLVAARQRLNRSAR